MLAQKLTFLPELGEAFFQEVPAAAAVFALRGDGEPYVSKTANLRKRLQRLLCPPTEQSRRLNLRDRVHEIEFALTGSDFESQFVLYSLLREEFPKTYSARLKLRPAPLVKLHLENEYPRASVTTRLGRFAWGQPPSAVRSSGARQSPSKSNTLISAEPDSRGRLSPHSLINLYYGPFFSRPAAEKFASDALDFFKMRRCVEDLHPDPAFPGCVYSEMKMCLAPCFKGCTDAEYHAEVSRVQQFFESQGESLAREFAEQRDQASAALAFEEAAAAHARIEKLKPLLSQSPEIVRRIDQLKALIIQPGVTQDTKGASQSVSLFRFRECALQGPVEFSIAPVAESRSMESRVEEMIAGIPPPGARSTIERIEHLAILKRWYYRSTRVGEIFFADQSGHWPMRRVVRGIGRVHKGEKSQEVKPTSLDSPTPS